MLYLFSSFSLSVFSLEFISQPTVFVHFYFSGHMMPFRLCPSDSCQTVHVDASALLKAVHISESVSSGVVPHNPARPVRGSSHPRSLSHSLLML